MTIDAQMKRVGRPGGAFCSVRGCLQRVEWVVGGRDVRTDFWCDEHASYPDRLDEAIDLALWLMRTPEEDALVRARFRRRIEQERAEARRNAPPPPDPDELPDFDEKAHREEQLAAGVSPSDAYEHTPGFDRWLDEEL